ncbi:MAG: glycosyltransferase family 2 protein [Desulfosarcina sp.]|nr:glycosyltransferase family 2 protein [Desulfosarcina sp.]
MPKVSVIIPTYNRAKFLGAAIRSALTQTYSDIEIIVSDDKSTDQTREVVEGFKDPRVKYVRNKGNKGPSATRNTAILSSEGEYIAFLDDDDEWLPDKLQCQIEVLDKSPTNICGVYTNRLFIEKTTGKILSDNPGTKRLRGNLLNQLIVKSPISTPTVVIKKKYLDEVGLFDETISYMEDYDLWIRLSMNWDFEYISKPLTKVYVHGLAHLSRNLEGQISGKEAIFGRYPHLFKENKKRWSEYLLAIGVQYCQVQKMKEGRKNLLKSVYIYPFKKIAYYHLFASLFTPNYYQRLRNIYKTVL